MKIIRINIFLFNLMMLVIFSGCIKDSITPPETFQLDNSALVLSYLETQGDYINTEAPSLINASHLYENLNNYLIVDVRSSEQFAQGHIAGAVNISNSNLLEFLNEKSPDRSAMVVLVSKNGQSSAYYTSLLRLYGYTNSYSLDFGMASWNPDFAGEWKDHLKTLQVIRTFTDSVFQKAEPSALPRINIGGTGNDLESSIKARISELITKGFIQDTNYIYISSIFNGGIDEFPRDKYYLACYGNGRLYNTPIFEGPTPGMGHAPFTVFYEENLDLRSGSNLQTMRTDKIIAIYSYAGQLSAFVAAYLRLLGYNAKSIMFGANNIFYSRMEWDPYLSDHAFTSDKIMNYPYVTGN